MFLTKINLTTSCDTVPYLLFSKFIILYIMIIFGLEQKLFIYKICTVSQKKKKKKTNTPNTTIIQIIVEK